MDGGRRFERASDALAEYGVRIYVGAVPHIHDPGLLELATRHRRAVEAHFVELLEPLGFVRWVPLRLGLGGDAVRPTGFPGRPGGLARAPGAGAGRRAVKGDGSPDHADTQLAPSKRSLDKQYPIGYVALCA